MLVLGECDFLLNNKGEGDFPTIAMEKFALGFCMFPPATTSFYQHSLNLAGQAPENGGFRRKFHKTDLEKWVEKHVPASFWCWGQAIFRGQLLLNDTPEN